MHITSILSHTLDSYLIINFLVDLSNRVFTPAIPSHLCLSFFFLFIGIPNWTTRRRLTVSTFMNNNVNINEFEA
jgi:hypothetical protein